MELRERGISSEYLKWGVMVFGSVLILFGTANRVFTFAALGLYAAVLIFGDDEMAVVSIVYIMPFATLFKPSPGAVSFLTYLMLLYAAKELVTTGVLPAAVLPFMVYVVIGECAVQKIDIQRTLKLLAGLLFINYAVISRERYSKKKIFLAYIGAIILSSMFRFLDSGFFRIARYMDEVDLVGEAARFSGLNNDANMYVINVIISLCLVVFLDYKDEQHPLLTISFSGVLTYLAILTYSKSAAFMLFIPLLLFVYSNQKKKRYRIQALLVIAGVAVIVGIAAGKIHAFDVVLSRLIDSGGDVNKLTTGRTSLWSWYIQYYFSNIRILLFGGGLGSGLIYRNHVHNTFLQIPYYIGVVGEIWLFLVLRSIMCYENNRKNPMHYSVLLCIVVMYFFLSELFDYQAPVHLLLASLVLNDQEESER